MSSFFRRMRTFLVFGAPGSGKGTAGKILGSIPRFHHMACGDIFRQLDTRTPMGAEFVSYSSKGLLVPDDLTVNFWNEVLRGQVATHQFKPDIDFLVLDGIPRNVAQAELMEEHIDVAQILHLTCPDRSVLTERLRKRALKDNRIDDASDEVTARRIQTYEEESKPVLEFYPPDIIHQIDARNPPAVVLNDALDRILSLPVWRRAYDYEG